MPPNMGSIKINVDGSFRVECPVGVGLVVFFVTAEGGGDTSTVGKGSGSGSSGAC